MAMHDFQKDLAFSNDPAWDALWENLYREAFPTYQSMSTTVVSLQEQRQGIDRYVTLAGGKLISLDEKLRRTVYSDILLEYWSVWERRKPGWIAKDAYCDYLGYAFPSIGRAYLLPFQPLRLAWQQHRHAWVRQYRCVDARNATYITRSVAVPFDIILDAVRDACCIVFDPWAPVGAIPYRCKVCREDVVQLDLWGTCPLCAPLDL